MDQEMKQAFDLLLSEFAYVKTEVASMNSELGALKDGQDRLSSAVTALSERQAEHTRAIKTHDKHLKAAYDELWRLSDLVDTKADKIAQ